MKRSTRDTLKDLYAAGRLIDVDTSQPTTMGLN
jgi:hypothetical protein